MAATRVPVILLALALLGTACGPAGDSGTATGSTTTSSPVATPPAVADASIPPPEDTPSFDQVRPVGTRVVVREVARRPHDPTAFTQGFVFDEGRLFESRGLYASQEQVILTEIDPADGTALRRLERDPADGDVFAEGLTVVDDRLIQLTWREGIALVHDRDTFERVGTFTYEGEGWGLCTQPDRLVMSDGTPTLTFRDRESFEVLDTVTVTLDGAPVERLNELACVDGLVWANVWQTPTIVVVDPDDGQVVTVVDASSLADRNGRFVESPSTTDTLNGIAYDDRSGTWLLTGKLWPWMFEVAFDCVEGCGDDTAVTPSHYIRPRHPPPPRPSA